MNGRPRRSTLVLGAVFVAALALYLWVRPDPVRTDAPVGRGGEAPGELLPGLVATTAPPPSTTTSTSTTTTSTTSTTSTSVPRGAGSPTPTSSSTTTPGTGTDDTTTTAAPDPPAQEDPPIGAPDT